MDKIIFSNYDDKNNPYYAGGGALAVHEVGKRLAQDFSVTVLTGKYPGSKNETVDGVQYERIGIGFAGPFVGQLCFQFCLPFQAFFKSYDVWIESFTPPFSTACLQLFTGKPVIGLTHLLGGESMWKKYHIPFHWFERMGLKTYKYLIALHEGLKSKIQSISPKTKIAVIPNGISQEEVDRSVPEKEDYIVFLGRIDVAQKGLDLLLESLPYVLKKSSVKVYIAGSGVKSDELFLQTKLQSSGFGERVKLLGRVEGKEKQELLGKALLMLMPSREEALPLAAMDAFAAKLPLVTYDIPGFSWAPETVAVKAKPFNTKEYADLVVKLLNDRVLLNEMGEHAKEFVKGYNWDSISQKYKEFISDVGETK